MFEIPVVVKRLVKAFADLVPQHVLNQVDVVEPLRPEFWTSLRASFFFCLSGYVFSFLVSPAIWDLPIISRRGDDGDHYDNAKMQAFVTDRQRDRYSPEGDNVRKNLQKKENN
jgi:hypothetical protein